VNSYLKAWDRDYCSRGRLWGGEVKDLPQMPAGSAILELGCGNGKTLSAMLSQPWRITALDVSMEAVRLCRASCASDKVDLLAADARHLPFPDRIFDAVFAFHMVGHVPMSEREKIASETARVLKVGGMLFFRDFGVDDMRAGQGMEVEPGTFRRGRGVITHYFTKEEVDSLFCQLMPVSVANIHWKMRIKGKDMIRCEIEAIFQKVVI
jgi:ubiquinone/menaquinone biosynthesis C-methylase UbiE